MTTGDDPADPPPTDRSGYLPAHGVDQTQEISTRAVMLDPSRPDSLTSGRPGTDELFFRAEQRDDGLYAITLTEGGLQTFETALAIARDLGSKTRISTRSSIEDVMERTAIREELSELLRRGGTGAVYQLRVATLRRRLRGSEEPSGTQRLIGHLGKALIVAVFFVWMLMQFVAAYQDIAAIPGILADLPNAILHLDPSGPIDAVGAKISDAGTRALFGVLGVALTLLVAQLLHPFGTIYRRDQMLPGERLLLRWASAALRRAEESGSDRHS